jgi:superfamily II DNA or RNA helicase
MVEVHLNEEILETGEIPLSYRQANELALPLHAVDVVCLAAGEEIVAQWRPTAGVLGGERLQEHLQLHATANGLVQLQRSGERLELRCVGMRQLPINVPPEPLPHTPPPNGQTRRREERHKLDDPREYRWYDGVGVHMPTRKQLVEALKEGRWDPEALFELRIRGEELAAAGGFEELLAPDLAHIQHMPHQIATVMKVLRHMGGRAVLADEVGLGKTIEAGLIMKELIVRGMARRILVLCPAGLREQWREELDTKFDERFTVVRSSSEDPGERVIMSLNLARGDLAERLCGRKWDLVVVDEAHKCIGGRLTRNLLGRLDTHRMLFLTATPVQNRLTELYELVELLRPGTFASRREFLRRFVDRNDPRRPVDAPALRRLVSNVMVRTTRAQVGLDRVKREAVDKPVELSETERRIYDLCTRGLRGVMTRPGDHLRRRQLAHRLTASPRALAATARRIASAHDDPQVRDFLEELSDLAIGFERTTRQCLLLEVLQRWTAEHDKGKVVVFTQHADTLDDLARILEEEGIEAALYHGGLSASARQRAVVQFRKSAPVMLSTDAGAEGLNLQFANCVVNYDLPWNPMKVEQRIGRVHRLTQPKDRVYVANLYAAGTIDERVYRLLRDKLRMFELLFGQVTTILGELDARDGGITFEGKVLEAFLAPDDAEMERRLTELGRRIDAAYHQAERAMSDEAGISSWIVDTSHRDEIRKQRADELRPKVKTKQRKRPQEVRQFVRDYCRAFDIKLSAIGKDLAVATLPPDLKDAFDGRDRLYLAFTPEALELHRDAELCAVGSDVLEDLILALREHGNLRALMPPPPEVPQEPWIRHVQGLRFLHREVLGPDQWAARTVWRVRFEVRRGADVVDVVDEICRILIGDPEAFLSPRHRELGLGESLPASFPSTKRLINSLIRESVRHLKDEKTRRQRELDQRFEEQRLLIRKNVYRRINELEDEKRRIGFGDRWMSLQEELSRLRRHIRRMKILDVEVFGRLLAVQLVGSPVLRVREKWSDKLGRVFSIEGTWSPAVNANQVEYRDPGGVIRRLALCTRGHPVDMSRSRTCPVCRPIN